MNGIVKTFFKTFNFNDKDEAASQASYYANKHPDKFKLVGVDDSHASNSILLFIKHEDQNTEVIFIPQLSNDPIVTFYLDDYRIKTLAKVTKELSGGK
jgi:hypothetical protein